MEDLVVGFTFTLGWHVSDYGRENKWPRLVGVCVAFVLAYGYCSLGYWAARLAAYFFFGI